MVVGIFSDTFYPEINGVTTSILLLKRELENLGHTVYVVTTSNPALKYVPDIAHTFRLPSAPFIFLPSRRMALFYKKRIAHIIGALKLDIIHTNTEFSLGFFGKLIAAALNKPVVHTYHTLYKDYVHYITKGRLPNISADMARLYSRMYCNGCSLIITPTEKTKDLLIEYEVEKPIEIVPTGVDMEVFRPQPDDMQKIASIKAELGIGTNEKVILYVGRIAKEKSLDSIVRQMPEYLSTHKNDKLLIVGNGPFKAELMEIIAKCGISNNVIFAGERPWNEIALFYKLGSVFVSASQSETQGLTFIEAMAAGVPVLAKKDRSVENLVIDGQTGCLFEDDSQIPEKLGKIQNDRAFRDSLVSNAYSKASEYSCEAFAKRVEALYERAISDWEINNKKYIISNPVFQKILL